MPIYEYSCPKCGTFEAMQKFSDKPLKCKPDCTEKNCPKKAERLISASAFHLKGSGWYKTDYSSGSNGASSGSGKVKKADSSSGSDSADAGAGSGGGEGSGSESGGDDTKKGKGSALKKRAKGPCGSGCGCH